MIASEHRAGATCVRVGVVLLASFALGILTSYAQGFLPDAARPFANSASGWTLLTAVLVFWSRAHTGLAAVLGAASFVLLVLGYTTGAMLHSLYYNPTLFGLVGLVVGPAVGVASAWLRSDGIRAALGTALLAGIAIGESIYGLTVIIDSTGPTYWVAIGIAGIGLLGAMIIGRLRRPLPAILATAGTALVADAFLLAYQALGSTG